MIEVLKFFMTSYPSGNFVSEGQLRRCGFDRNDIEHLVQLNLLRKREGYLGIRNKNPYEGISYGLVGFNWGDCKRKHTTAYSYSHNREVRRLAHLRRKQERLKVA